MPSAMRSARPRAPAKVLAFPPAMNFEPLDAHPPAAPSLEPGIPVALSSDVDQKLDALRACLRQLGSVLVCYSGGIDSALVLAIAHEQLGDRAVAITAVSASLPAREREEAARFAQLL